MRIGLITAAMVIAVIGFAAPSAAQSVGAPGGTPSNMTTGGSHMGTSMNQETFNKLQDYADQAKRLTKDDKAKGKTLEQVLAAAKLKPLSFSPSLAALQPPARRSPTSYITPCHRPTRLQPTGWLLTRRSS